MNQPKPEVPQHSYLVFLFYAGNKGNMFKIQKNEGQTLYDAKLQGAESMAEYQSCTELPESMLNRQLSSYEATLDGKPISQWFFAQERRRLC